MDGIIETCWVDFLKMCVYNFKCSKCPHNRRDSGQK